MLVRRALSAGIWVAFATVAGTAHSQESADATIVSVQVRSQGYECTDPVTAEPDADASKPDEPVYILHCGNATYRVRLDPDQAAEVSKIE